jgi:tripartite-type tricarboxylate transporter receptor subunit TctC
MELSLKTRCLAAVWLTAILVAVPVSAFPLDYPTKPIRMVDGFPPGGGTDFLSRNIGRELTAAWGQPVIVDNRPGLSSNMGAGIAAASTPDGYTLFMACVTCLAPSVKLYPHLKYNLLKDLTPVSQVASGTYVLLVSSSLKVNSVRDLIALAKSKPAQLNYASSGVGSTAHLAGELFKLRAGVNILHVPYKGGAPAAASIATGETQIFYGSVPASMPMINSGKAKALAVTTPSRARGLPDVPTVAESGLPGFDISVNYGILAPTGTPKSIIAKLNHEIARILHEKSISDRFGAFGLEPTPSSPQAFGKLIRNEVAKWTKVVEMAKIRIN